MKERTDYRVTTVWTTMPGALMLRHYHWHIHVPQEHGASGRFLDYIWPTNLACERGIEYLADRCRHFPVTY